MLLFLKAYTFQLFFELFDGVEGKINAVNKPGIKDFFQIGSLAGDFDRAGTKLSQPYNLAGNQSETTSYPI